MSESTLRLQIQGMRCASCKGAVEEALRSESGPELRVSVNLADHSASVAGELPDDLQPRLLDAVARAGYRAEPATEGSAASAPDREATAARQRAIVAVSLAAPWIASMIGMAVGHHVHWPPLFEAVVAGAILAGPGATYFVSAVRALRHGRTNMDTLIALGSGVSYAYSIGTLAGWWTVTEGSSGLFFESAAFLIAFLSIGKWLEVRARHHARQALVGLLALLPSEARRLRGGQEEMVELDALESGDLVVVRAGERLPADGRIVKGEASLDTSILTGESVPERYRPGDEVTGGVLDLDGRLEIRVTRTGASTVLASMVRLVEEAQAQTAPIERVADRVSRVFVPVVLAVGAITLGAWLVLGSGGVSEALARATAVVVIACPCALGLATPTAIMVGSALGLRRGILIKNGAALELLGRVDRIYLDKTGTVTTGQFGVESIATGSDTSEDEVLRIAASLEMSSNHPLAQGIVDTAVDRGIALTGAESVEERSGYGLRGDFEGASVTAGRREFLVEQGIELPDLDLPDATAVWVGRAGRYLGTISLADTIRADAPAAVRKLKELGISIGILTGDRSSVASAVAERLGIDDVHAELAPGGKNEIIQTARDAGHRVAMVGDGINDAPALAAADVGIAMGSGAEIARDSGDVVLTTGDLASLVHAVRLSRATLARIHGNLGWAFVYNLVGIPIAAGVFAAWGLTLRPEFAGLAMALSSVSVVSNSIFLETRAGRIFEALPKR